MSIYEEYQKCIFWNKVTNREYLNNILKSFDQLYKEFKNEKTKRQQSQRAQYIQTQAEEVYSNVIHELSKTYKKFAQISSSDKAKHLQTIKYLIQHTQDNQKLQKYKAHLQRQIVKKIQKNIQSTFEGQSSKKYALVLYEPDAILSQEEIMQKREDLVAMYINMYSLFSRKYLYYLNSTKQLGYNRYENNSVIVDFFPLSDRNHMKLGLTIIDNERIISEYYIYKSDCGKSNISSSISYVTCCHTKAGEQWLNEISDGSHHNIDKLLFAIYLINISKFEQLLDQQKRVKNSLTTSSYWSKFKQRLPAVLGFLINRYPYEAFAYLHQQVPHTK